MIYIPPPWKGDRADDIWALYDFLLYQSLPFAPGDYLPQDAVGPYYYKNGDRTKGKTYPDQPKHSFHLTKASKKTLTGLKVPHPTTLEELIKLVSPQLYAYLYSGGAVNRDHLIELLTTQTDEDTLTAKKLDFALNPALKGNPKIKETTLWKLLLSNVFSYDTFSRQPLFPELIRMMGVEVCPYCNRSFTTTVKSKKGKKTEYHRQNQVDHYRSKSQYPWFALTLPNLIPACGNCNQKKSDGSGYVLYPYLEELGDRYQFRTRMKAGGGYLMGQPADQHEFEVEIVPTPGRVSDPAYCRRAAQSIQTFGLDVLYRESHNAYICALYEQRYIFDDAYLDSLIDSFPEHFKTREDVRRLLYMKRYDASSYGSAPLAKLTHDIDAEISRYSHKTKP